MTIAIDNFYAKTIIMPNGMMEFGQTVLDHCICVGEVAMRIAEFYGFSKIGKKTIGLVCALHDIGKMSPVFQYKIGNDELIKALGFEKNFDLSLAPNPNRFSCDENIGKHSGAGSYYLDNFLHIGKSKTVNRIVARHHGFTVGGLYPWGDISQAILNCGDAQNMGQYIEQMVKRLEEHFCIKLSDIENIEDANIEMISGYLSVADWMASKKYASVKDLSTVNFDTLLDEYGFKKLALEDKTYHEMFGFDLYGYQKSVVDTINDYGFYLLEMGTGNGKTEIGLSTAYKLIKSGKCNGMYFALPTQVTSNKIFDRVSRFVSNVATDKDEADLVHSRSLQVLFEIAKKKEQEDIKNGVNTVKNNKFSFFKSNKNLRLLNNVIAGTVDQLLYAVLNSKYNFIRECALWHKVIIIDEVHCYDSFTSELICRLKDFCVANECVVIALSATVSDTLKGKLFGNGNVFLKNYPMLSSYVDGSFAQLPVNGNYEKRKFHVSFEKNDIIAWKKAVKEAESGEQILWIENTVVKSQKTYEKIMGLVKANGSNVEVGLLHSHFTQHDRFENEGKWIGILGKDAMKNGDRAKHGRILIATQVAEQSLDIDADKIYTRICPIDALGQRLGRVGRFGRTVNEFEVVILSQYDCEDYRTKAGLDWFFKAEASEFSAFIYPKVILYRTLEYLENHRVIEYPKDYREQLNYVYDSLQEINGFDKYNAFLEEYETKERDNKTSAERIEAQYGKTKKDVDVITRQIVDKGKDTLLITKRNGNVYTLMSGDVVDRNNKLSLEDIIKIEANTVSIPIDGNVKIDTAHSDFADCMAVEMTATVDLNGDVEFFSDLSTIGRVLAGYKYTHDCGLKKG